VQGAATVARSAGRAAAALGGRRYRAAVQGSEGALERSLRASLRRDGVRSEREQRDARRGARGIVTATFSRAAVQARYRRAARRRRRGLITTWLHVSALTRSCSS